MVSLRQLSRENVRAVCDLRLPEDQRALVAPAAYTVAEGHYEPGALLRASYADEQPAGVLLVEVDGGAPYLVRFMVDEIRLGFALLKVIGRGLEALRSVFIARGSPTEGVHQ